ncbi:MAG: lipoyl synthase [Planctomycetota bacterium]
MTTRDEKPARPRRRLPGWLKRRLPAAGRTDEIRRLLDGLHLATVCDGAHCPNRGECYARGTATFMILGETCTRNCRFCAVDSRDPGPPRADEPADVAEAAGRMGLSYVVVTSVTRDDLPDGGAGHFAATIQAIRRRLPDARVEVLTPDFQGDQAAIRTVLQAGPDVFNHNVETVRSLYKSVRPQADYRQSLDVLAAAGRIGGALGKRIFTKSGLMVGLGETREEIREVLDDLRAVGCDILTVGQYLAPSEAHYPVERFVPPEEFAEIEAEAREMGFKAVAAGPFVRSSYRADEVFEQGES